MSRKLSFREREIQQQQKRALEAVAQELSEPVPEPAVAKESVVVRPSEPKPDRAAGAVGASERLRLQLDLSPTIAGLLERASAVTGVPKAQIVVRCLLDGLPALLDLADDLKARAV